MRLQNLHAGEGVAEPLDARRSAAVLEEVYVRRAARSEQTSKVAQKRLGEDRSGNLAVREQVDRDVVEPIVAAGDEGEGIAFQDVDLREIEAKRLPSQVNDPRITLDPDDRHWTEASAQQKRNGPAPHAKYEDTSRAHFRHHERPVAGTKRPVVNGDRLDDAVDEQRNLPLVFPDPNAGVTSRRRWAWRTAPAGYPPIRAHLTQTRAFLG